MRVYQFHHSRAGSAEEYIRANGPPRPSGRDGPLAAYRTAWAEYQQGPPPAPLTGDLMFCHADAERAEQLAHEYMANYYLSIMSHYELVKGHFKDTKGYEFYAAMSEAQRRSADQATEAYLDLQVWGTPAMCQDRIVKTLDRMGSEHFSCVFSYAGMPYPEAERNLRLFASEVMPKLQRL